MSWKAQNPQVSGCTFSMTIPDMSAVEIVKSKPCDLFDIPFEVPYTGATRNLNGITSQTTFQAFLMALSKRMDVRLSLLSHIGYIPSFAPKSPKPVPKLLEDQEDWDSLIDCVRQHRSLCLERKGGKGAIKPYSVKIIDTSEPGGKETSSKKAFLMLLFVVMCSDITFIGFEEVLGCWVEGEGRRCPGEGT